MISWLVKAFSFFAKEIHEVRRQPRLLLSLIAGPFLVLALFGATFRSSKPMLRTVLVWPETGIPGVEREEVERLIDRNFHLVGVKNNRLEAMQMLERGEVDVVQVLPSHIPELVEGARRPELQVFSYVVDPGAEAWILSMLLGQVNHINREVLLSRTNHAQQMAVTIQVELLDTQGMLSQLELNFSPEKVIQAETALRKLRYILTSTLAILPAETNGQESLTPELQELRRQIFSLLTDLDELDQAIRNSQIEIQTERLKRINQQLDGIQGYIDIFVGLPPEVIVSPLKPTYANLHGEVYSLMIYYAPGVLALLIQHLAITLGALALVRERLIGSFEMFRIAPLKISHLLLGKTLAYILYVAITGLALVGLLHLLNVPFLGPGKLFFALVLLMITASVGIGLLISALSTSDSQAVQLTMITLLLSIFFTGFFLPLRGFSVFAQPVSVLLPMTHGLAGLQALMLMGRSPEPGVWIGLASISVVAYFLVLLVMRRVYRKVMS